MMVSSTASTARNSALLLPVATPGATATADTTAQAQDSALGSSDAAGGGSLGLEGIRVTLSELGKSKSAASQKNQDIDDSTLPDLIKQMLKLIRDLKLQIEQKMVELEAVTGSRGMSSDEQQVRMQALQSELATLNGALSGAYASLAEAMRDMQLSSADMQTAMELVM